MRRRVAIAPELKIEWLESNTDGFARVFGLDGLEGDQPGCVGRVILDAPQLERPWSDPELRRPALDTGTRGLSGVSLGGIRLFNPGEPPARSWCYALLRRTCEGRRERAAR